MLSAAGVRRQNGVTTGAPDTRLQVRVSSEIGIRFRRIAALRGVSATELARQWLTERLAVEEGQIGQESQGENRASK